MPTWLSEGLARFAEGPIPDADIAALKTAAASAADRDQLAADLKDACAQIATLKTAVVTAATEKAALEKKVSELAAAPAPDTAGYEARIRK